MPFPTQFPEAAMEHLVQELLGASTEPVGQLAADAYDVLGYGLFLVFGGNAPPAGKYAEHFASVGTMTDEDKAQVLKDACHPQATAIPWQTILPIVMSLLEKLLAG